MFVVASTLFFNFQLHHLFGSTLLISHHFFLKVYVDWYIKHSTSF